VNIGQKLGLEGYFAKLGFLEP